MSGKNPLGNGKEPQSYEGTNAIFPVQGFQVIRSKRDPTTNDFKYPVTSIWVNTVLENVWIQVAPGGVWIQLANSSGDFLITAPLTTNGVVFATGSNGGTSTAAGTSGQLLQSKGAGTPPAYTTATYPTTTVANDLLYSSATNTVSNLPSANNGMLVTSATGVPSILAGPGVAGELLMSNAAAAPSFLATANNGTLVTSATGVPSILAGPGTTGQVLTSNAAAAPSWQSIPQTTIVDQISSTRALQGGTTYVTDNGASPVIYTLPVTVNIGTSIRIIGASAGGWKVAQNAGQTISQGGQVTTSGTGGSLSSTNKNDCIELTAQESTTNGWVISSSNGTLTFV